MTEEENVAMPEEEYRQIAEAQKGSESTETAGYAGLYHPGEELLYHGPLPIDGKVTVVEWTPSKWRGEGCVGDLRFRPGLIPVFSENFPETRFWWVSQLQVDKA